MDTTRAVGNFLTLSNPAGTAFYRFQNFYIQQAIDWSGESFAFLPFGFSGVTVDSSGANVEASLLFPNNTLSRDWATTVVSEGWLVNCDVVVIDNITTAPTRSLHTYVGQVSGAGWDEVAVNVKTSSILDAVGSDVPNRRLNRALVGALPVTDAIRL